LLPRTWLVWNGAEPSPLLLARGIDASMQRIAKQRAYLNPHLNEM
jgi:hypothetical protein